MTSKDALRRANDKLTSRLKVDAKAFRQAAQQILAVAAQLPPKKCATEVAWLESIALGLKFQSHELERLIKFPDPESVGLLARLGIRTGARARVALVSVAAIVGTGALEAVGDMALRAALDRAESDVNIVIDRSQTLQVEAETLNQTTANTVVLGQATETDAPMRIADVNLGQESQTARGEGTVTPPVTLEVDNATSASFIESPTLQGATSEGSATVTPPVVTAKADVPEPEAEPKPWPIWKETQD